MNILNQKFKKNNIIFFIGFIILLLFNIQIALLYLLTWICIFPVFTKNYDFFRPINYFSCWYYYYYGLGYVCYNIRKEFRITQKFDYNVMINAQIISILIIILLKLLLHYFPIRKSIKQINQDSFFINNNIPLLIIVTIFNFGISVLFWKKLGGIPLFIKGYHDSNKALLGKGLGYFEYLQSFCVLLLCLFLMSSFYKKKDKIFSYLIIIFNLIVIPLLSDTRSTLIYNLILFLIFYSWNKKNIKVITIFFSGLFVIILAAIWGVYRGGNIASIGIVILAEIGVEFDNYVDVIKMFPNQFEFTYGSTYIPCLTLLLPRAIMPNKNSWMTGGEYFKYIKNHDYIRVGERFTFAGELFMNFGILGAIIITPVIFYLLLRVSTGLYDKYFNQHGKTHNFKIEMFSYLFLKFSLGLLAGDTATAFSSSFYNFFFIILVFIIFAQMKNNNTKGGTTALCKFQ